MHQSFIIQYHATRHQLLVTEPFHVDNSVNQGLHSLNNIKCRSKCCVFVIVSYLSPWGFPPHTVAFVFYWFPEYTYYWWLCSQVWACQQSCLGCTRILELLSSMTHLSSQLLEGSLIPRWECQFWSIPISACHFVHGTLTLCFNKIYWVSLIIW